MPESVAEKDQLPSPSAEQEAALLSVQEGHNVALHSVAGSGKTTFSLHVAKRVAPRKVLMLTYNAQLKVETRQKVKKLGLSDNVEVHSFHSFGYKYFSPECRTDAGLCDVLGVYTGNDVQDPNSPIVADVLIIDECQDLKHLFLRLVRQIEQKSVRSHANHAQLQYIVVGDPRQSIYGFQGADERYLTLAPFVFDQKNKSQDSQNSREWKMHTLSVTWRLTDEMASLVNDGFLAGDQVLSAPRKSPTGSLPTYHVCNAYGDVPFFIIMGWLHGIEAQESACASHIPYADDNDHDGGGTRLRPSQIMILAPSLRSARSAVRRLENKLVRFGVPVYVPISDEEPLDKKAIKGKLLFLTYHQAKGSERDAVLVFGMDQRPLASATVVDEDEDTVASCPNPAYVALTRAKRHLAILQHEKNDPPSYMDTSVVGQLAVVTGAKADSATAAAADSKPAVDGSSTVSMFSVHGLLRHLLPDALKQMGSMLSYSERKCDSSDSSIMNVDVEADTDTGWVQHVTSKHNMVESVSEINGIMIPLLLEVECLGSSSVLDITLCKCPLLQLRSKLLEVKQKLPAMSVEDALFISTVYSACSSGYIFKAAQITRFDWLDKEVVAESLDWLRSIGAGSQPTDVFELELTASFEDNNNDDDDDDDKDMSSSSDASSASEISKSAVVKGRADVVTASAIYEIKCGNDEFQLEHLLQLALYGWMMNQNCDQDEEQCELLDLHQKQKNQRRRRLYLVYVVHRKVYELKNDPVVLDRMVRRLFRTKMAPEVAKVDDAVFIARAQDIR